MEQLKDARIIRFPAGRKVQPSVGDLRFRKLVGEDAWARLPEAVRARFGKRIQDCKAAVYVGEVLECRMSRFGWLLAQLGRLIGSPLPLFRDRDVPAVVSVTEDAAFGGQFWTRIYGRRNGFPQVVHSSKCFAGPTGLEEYVGCGVGVALRAEVVDGALYFVSDHYFVGRGKLRLRVPDWLAPGSLRVGHIDCNNGWFAFTLMLRHSVLGELISQTAMFKDAEVGA